QYDGSHDLDRWSAASLVEHDRAGYLTGSGRQDVVVEIANQRRIEHRSGRGAPVGNKERSPAQRARNNTQAKDDQGRYQPPVVAGAQRAPSLVESDAAQRDICEQDRDGDRREQEQKARTGSETAGGRERDVGTKIRGPPLAIIDLGPTLPHSPTLASVRQ